MKNILVSLFAIITLTSCYESLTRTTDKAAQYQKELIEFYNNPSTTPLNEMEKKDFKGLTFFPLNKDFIVEAKFQPILNGEIIPFSTSANKIKRYKEHGTLTFTINDIEEKLTAYVPEPLMESQEDYLFIPFRDGTSGKSSYGAGRYLELSTADVKQGNVLLDFNMAYNPYCAYSTMYNCPIPPANNFLKSEITAGASYQY